MTSVTDGLHEDGEAICTSGRMDLWPAAQPGALPVPEPGGLITIASEEPVPAQVPVPGPGAAPGAPETPAPTLAPAPAPGSPAVAAPAPAASAPDRGDA